MIRMSCIAALVGVLCGQAERVPLQAEPPKAETRPSLETLSDAELIAEYKTAGCAAEPTPLDLYWEGARGFDMVHHFAGVPTHGRFTASRREISGQAGSLVRTVAVCATGSAESSR